VSKTYTLEDYQPYIGKLGNERLAPLPNAEDVDPLEFLNNLASGGHGMTPVWGYALLPDGGRPQWTQFFLTTYMMSGCDGGGYAVTYGAGKLIEGTYQCAPIVRRFAICKHEKTEEGYRSNHERGWHPGHCKLCGYGMSYDSGD
jgi:hypothetical protein